MEIKTKQIIKDLRVNNKLNQEDISKILNVSRSTYNGYELGKHEPNLEILTKLADYYKVTLDYLVGRKFNSIFDDLTSEELNFIKSFLLLDQQNKFKIASYCLTLLAQQED